MIDYEFFKKVAKEVHTPRGSSVPHPDSWRGKGEPEILSEHQIKATEAIDLSQPIYQTDKTGKRYRRSLTTKQKLLAHYLLQGFNKRQAMLKAGYGINWATKANGKKGSGLAVVYDFVDGMRGKLQAGGLNDDYIVGKFKQWFEAQKVVSARRTGKEADALTDDFIEVDDFETQIKAYDRYKDIMVPKGESGPKGFKKREISLTEWIRDQPKEETQDNG